MQDFKTNKLPVLWVGERNTLKRLCCLRRWVGRPAVLTFQRQRWERLGVGDLVLLTEDARIPADLLLLKVAAKTGESFVQTANLDGERNLKRKSAALQGALAFDGAEQLPYLSERDYELIHGSQLAYTGPQKALDKFAGLWRLPAGPGATADAVPLSAGHLVLRGSNMANCGWALGLVVFAGGDTKLQLNQDKSRYKESRMGRMVNRAVVVIAVLQMLVCLAMGLGALAENPARDLPFALSEANAAWAWGRAFLSFYVLLGTFIPVSLLVTLEVIRVLQMVVLQADREMKDPLTGQQFRAFNGVIPEDLGTITHIFSDKTGTLTANVMAFRALTFGRQEAAPTRPAASPPLAPLRASSELFDTPPALKSERLPVAALATPDTTPQKPTRSSVANPEPVPIPRTMPSGANVLELPTLRPEQDDFDTDEEPHELTSLTERKRRQQQRASGESSCERTREEVIAELRRVLAANQEGEQGPPSARDTTERPFSVSRSAMRFPERVIPFPPSSARDYLLCVLVNICVCNDVVPVFEERPAAGAKARGGGRRQKAARKSNEEVTLSARIEEGGEREPLDYEGGSPDEIELARTAKEAGVVLLGLRAGGVVEVLLRAERRVLRLQVRHRFEFSSEKRRMTVVVQEQSQGAHYLFCKGADSAVFALLRQEESGLVTDASIAALTAYSQLGFRTLCFGARQIPYEHERVHQWERELKATQQSAPGLERESRLTQL